MTTEHLIKELTKNPSQAVLKEAAERLAFLYWESISLEKARSTAVENYKRVVELNQANLDRLQEMANKLKYGNDWVSIKDRLPTIDGVYLCYTFNGRVRFSPFLTETKSFADYDITHWMMLPKPPRCSNDE